MHQNDHKPRSSGIYCRNARLIQHLQINKCDLPHKKLKYKNHMIIVINVEKALDKIQHLNYDKNSQQSGIRGNIPKHNKGHI